MEITSEFRVSGTEKKITTAIVFGVCVPDLLIWDLLAAG